MAALLALDVEGAGEAYILRDPTVTLIGFCGVSTKTIEATRRISSANGEVSVVGGFSYGDGSEPQNLLIFPPIAGDQLVIHFPTPLSVNLAEGAMHACSAPPPRLVKYLACGTATILEWESGVRWPTKMVDGVYADKDVETTPDSSVRGYALVNLGARLSEGRVVLKFALVKFGVEPDADRIRIALSGIYDYKRHREWVGLVRSPVLVGI